MLDKISIPKIHDSVGLLILEQRRQKQLLCIMCIHAKKGKSRSLTNVNTRSQTKYVFKPKQKWEKGIKNRLFIWVLSYGIHRIKQHKTYPVNSHL